ncbi:MAG TPA: CRISPR-associated endonuclease Cas3'' [Verrucomicrobiales bacterium]|nr:CRISPR-associated endonuclease Cas3'' [Verrucomicrobiales bacterium]
MFIRNSNCLNPAVTYFAHTLEGRPQEDWEPLERHLQEVAKLAGKFADAFGAKDWGRLAGLWHDLGKYSREFQAKLHGEHFQIEHTGAGAALAKEKIRSGWETLAFVIAGHHAGLANWQNKEDHDTSTPLVTRVERAGAMLEKCRALMEANNDEAMKQLLLMQKAPELPEWILSGGDEGRARWSCFIRMIFSALVDADSIATESFCSPEDKKTRLRAQPVYDSVEVLRERLDAHIDQLGKKAADSEVNRQRAQILNWCRESALTDRGFFTLNVPTGGGKTLAAMSFALRHVVEHRAKGMRRVIVAVPYTSIIEQNAGVYETALGAHNLIQHHSNLDDFEDREEADEATIRRRLACENWDAPVIVTTNVQLFESLFTHKRRRARKLHNIAGSVIILDEAQCVPVGYLQLIVPMLRDLVDHYGCTMVVSTATQPAWRQMRGKPAFGLPAEQMRPIIPPEAELSRVEGFDRVSIEWPKTKEPVLYEELALQLVAEPCVMAIVHRKKDAQWLARRLCELRPDEQVFHLSTNMCPVHRRSVLDKIRAAIVQFRDAGTPCRVVTTQLVEAGVDLDLPVIYRAMAGLDSITQAAGRCNREGKMAGKGRVVVFYAETEPPDPHLKRCAQITESMLFEADRQLDIRDPSTFEGYFKRQYHLADTDVKKLMRHVTDLNFETLGRELRLIDDSQQVPIVILYNEEARARLRTIQNIARSQAGEEVASRLAFRALQPYSVAVWPKGLAMLKDALEPLFPGSTALLLDPNFYPASYDAVFGLVTDDEPSIPPDRLVCGPS